MVQLLQPGIKKIFLSSCSQLWLYFFVAEAGVVGVLGLILQVPELSIRFDMDKVAAVRLAGHFENHFIHIRIRLLTRQPVDLQIVNRQLNNE